MAPKTKSKSIRKSTLHENSISSESNKTSVQINLPDEKKKQQNDVTNPVHIVGEDLDDYKLIESFGNHMSPQPSGDILPAQNISFNDIDYDEESEDSVSSSSKELTSISCEVDLMELQDVKNFVDNFETVPQLDDILLLLANKKSRKKGITESDSIEFVNYEKYVKLFEDINDSEDDNLKSFKSTSISEDKVEQEQEPEEEEEEEKEKEIDATSSSLTNDLENEDFVLIESSLKRINESRKNLSHCRLKCIFEKHTLACLHKKMKKLEDLGNDFSMNSYISLEIVNHNLFKKLDERKFEINKLRHRYHSDIHSRAHIKEKIDIAHDIIATQQKYLQKKQAYKNRWRQRIGALKAKHSLLFNAIREHTLQNGLIDSSIILADYLETLKEIESPSIICNNLRSIIRHTKQRIRSLLQYKCKQK